MSSYRTRNGDGNRFRRGRDGGGYGPLTIAGQSAAMIFTPHIAADDQPDDSSLLAMRAALRDLKVTMRKPEVVRDYPRRSEALAILNDARVRIARING
jgi:hypothetical protein